MTQNAMRRDVDSRTLLDNLTAMNAMWRVAMSEEVGKKMQAVVDRVNLAVTRRPKVSLIFFFFNPEQWEKTLRAEMRCGTLLHVVSQ